MQVSFALPSRGVGLPLSIPYRRIIQTTIDIQRAPDDSPDPVHVEVEGCSADNGVAVVIAGGEALATGLVLLRGEAQTSPGHSGQLRLRARFNNQTWTSDNFSVCAHPASVHNGPDHAPHTYIEIREDPFQLVPPTKKLMAGLFVEIRIKSDSLVDDDLDRVINQEVVSSPVDHSASMHGHPHHAPGQGKEEPATRARIDRHDIGVEQALEYASQLAGMIGSWSNDQVDRYKCERCDMQEWQVVPASGYRITRSLSTTSDGRVRLLTTKMPTRCTVSGLTTEPGPSPRIEAVVDLEKRLVQAQEGFDEWGVIAGLAQQ